MTPSTGSSDQNDYLVCGFTRHEGVTSGRIGCAKCGRSMWVSQTSKDMLIGNPSLIPICIICAGPKIKADPESEIVLTKAQELELLGHGITPEQIDETLKRIGAVREEDLDG